MSLRGEFRIRRHGSDDVWAVLPNAIFDDGQDAYLKILFRGDNTIVPAGGNWFVGLAGNLVVDPDSTLADITDEVGVVNGYARQPIVRDAAGFPTIEEVGVYHRAVSTIVTFTAAGGDFDKTFTRMFLTNASAGSGGLLFAFSAPLSSPKLIVDTESYDTQYIAYIL